VSGSGYANATILKSLKTVSKHWAVAFLQHVNANLDLKIRCDTDDVRIEGCMMKLAECEAVGNHRLTQGMAIRKNMRSFKQLVMSQPTDSTTLLVGAEHAFTEGPLVHAKADDRRNVFSSRGKGCRIVELRSSWSGHLVVNGHDKCEGFGVILDDEDRPGRFVETPNDAVQIDERGLSLHGNSQSDVISMAPVGPTIAVTEEATFDKSIIIGTITILNWRSCRNREGNFWKDSWLEYPLGPNQRDPGRFEVKAAF
jgi:hypothetical protein